jgi:hypothetical protein
MPPFQLESKLKRGETEILVIHCGDYRFQAGFSEFLNSRLNSIGWLQGSRKLLIVAKSWLRECQAPPDLQCL